MLPFDAGELNSDAAPVVGPVEGGGGECREGGKRGGGGGGGGSKMFQEVVRKVRGYFSYSRRAFLFLSPFVGSDQE